jgi:hypothetical protein
MEDTAHVGPAGRQAELGGRALIRLGARSSRSRISLRWVAMSDAVLFRLGAPVSLVVAIGLALPIAEVLQLSDKRAGRVPAA